MESLGESEDIRLLSRISVISVIMFLIREFILKSI